MARPAIARDTMPGVSGGAISTGRQQGLLAVLANQTTMMSYPQKIPFGELRASCVCDVLNYCRDHRCSHHIAISADRWPDHVRLSDIEPDFVCTSCGKRGADVRPLFEPARMSTA